MGAPRVPAFHHYVAYEPWYGLGGTIGAALSSEARPKVMYGLWEGFPLNTDAAFSSKGPQWMATIAVGWRAFGSQHSLYFSPKLWWYHGYDINL